MRENDRLSGSVANAIGRISAERDEAVTWRNTEAKKGDFFRQIMWQKKYEGLQRAIQILIEEGVFVP